MKKLILNLIKFYQKYLSPANFGADTCIYEPSCSNYMYKAVKEYDIIRGTLMGLWRVLRCNPFAKGGYDPVPPEKKVQRKEK